MNNYFLIAVDSSKTSNISSFESYENAETAYFRKFKERENSNFVLTKIGKPNFKRLFVAYASYVLTKHDYMNIWGEITEDILEYAIEKGNEDQSKTIINYIRSNCISPLKDRT